MPSTRSSAATKCISEVPGLAKHTSTPPATKVRTRLSAPFMTRPSAAGRSNIDQLPDVGQPCHSAPDKSIDPSRPRRNNSRGPSGRSIHQREESVLVDHRTYRIKPGAMNAYLDNYEKFGFAPQTRHLGQPVAYMFSESGEINTLVHIWAYEDAADRMKRRAAMQADADWQVFVRKNAEGGNLVQQTTMLMVPAKFAPIKR